MTTEPPGRVQKKLEMQDPASAQIHYPVSEPRAFPGKALTLAQLICWVGSLAFFGIRRIIRGLCPQLPLGSTAGESFSARFCGLQSQTSTAWSLPPVLYLLFLEQSESESISRSVGSDTLRPPWTVQPTRLLCPWDSPGKNAGVGCHALLQGMFQSQGSNLGLLQKELNYDHSMDCLCSYSSLLC